MAPILLGCVVAIALLHAASQPVSTNDLHIFLAMGRWMTGSGEILRSEVFTWTAQGTPFTNPTWGFSCLSWALYQGIGVEGLRLINGGMVALALLAVNGSCRALKLQPKACALATLYAWLLLLQNLAVRGQTWVFLLLPLAIWLGVQRRHPALHLLGGLVLGALWSNLHGSFPVALIWLGIWGGGRIWASKEFSAAAPAWLSALGLAIGTLCNPEVTGVWSFLYENSSSPLARGFIEWYAPDFLSFAGARLYGALAIWGLLALRRRPDWVSVILVLTFGVLAARGTRFIAWFGLASAPLLALWLSQQWTAEGQEGWPRRWVQILGVTLALFFLALGARLLPPDRGLKDPTPIAAVEALKQSCGECTGERILNPPEYGGYLNVEVPGLQTSGDIRSWVFPDPAWQIYLDLCEAPADWEERLREQQVDYMLLWRPTQAQSLIPAVLASPDWELLAEDEMSLLVRRREGGGLVPLSKPPNGE
jgi:hypothetical protein